MSAYVTTCRVKKEKNYHDHPLLGERRITSIASRLKEKSLVRLASSYLLPKINTPTCRPPRFLQGNVFVQILLSW